jgi:hypothetical protein
VVAALVTGVFQRLLNPLYPGHDRIGFPPKAFDLGLGDHRLPVTATGA